MINGKKFSQLEIILLVSAVVTLIVTASIVAYSLGFLSTKLWNAISSDPVSKEKIILFDVKGFEQLGL